MRKFNRKLSSVMVALTAMGLSVQEVQAKNEVDFGPAVDAFCLNFNGTTPFADAPPALGVPGCGLCHAPAFTTEPQWTWWAQGDSSGDFSPFCPNVVENTPPTANAGADQTVTEGDTVTLNAGGSNDADGDSLTYLWSLNSAPAGSTAALSDPNAVMPNFLADVEGDYQFRLVVNDGQADSAPDVVVITTQSGNTAPVADAGPDQTAVTGDTVTLNAGGSSDVDGDTLTYQWSLSTRPSGSGAALSDPAAVMPDFVADVEGEYVARLVVNDGQLESAPDSVTILTESGNVAPVADAGPDQTVAQGDLVELDASGSSDVNGDNLTYLWSLVSTPAGSSAMLSDPTAVMPNFTADLDGDYVVQLQVNDGQLDSTADTLTVKSSSGNMAPVADAGSDQTVMMGDSVSLDAGNSSDADGDTLSYQWSLISRPAGSMAILSDPNAEMPDFVADVDGEYVAQLVVNDGTQNSAPTTVTITTEPGNTAPMADAGADQVVMVGDDVALNAAGSSDVNGDALSYFWSLISAPDGSTATLSTLDAVTTGFTADVEGEYVVQLIVNDGMLDGTPDTVAVTAGTDVQVDEIIFKAKWNSKKSKLKVQGRKAPAGATVQVKDAETGDSLGTATVRHNGKWKLIATLSESVDAPCTIIVEFNGQAAEGDVKKSPSCGEVDDDHEDDNDEHDQKGDHDEDDEHDEKDDHDEDDGHDEKDD